MRCTLQVKVKVRLGISSSSVCSAQHNDHQSQYPTPFLNSQTTLEV